jgi:Lipopolysaccharide-assembly
MENGRLRLVPRPVNFFQKRNNHRGSRLAKASQINNLCANHRYSHRKSLSSGALVALLCGWLPAFLCGCGYTLAGSTTSLPKDVKAIFIPLVRNQTVEPTLTSLMTEALQDQVGQYGTIDIVDSANQSDAIFDIQLARLKRMVNTTTGDTDTSLQQSVSVVLNAQLRRTNGQILWRAENMEISQSYAATSSAVIATSPNVAGGNLGTADIAGLNSRELARGQEANALSQIATSAAKKLYDLAIAADF